MILVDGKEVAGECLVEAATSNAVLQEANEVFLGRGQARYNETSTHKRRKCVYVLQNELASVDSGTDDAVLASDDATTCVIVVVVCEATGVASVAHLDEQTSRSDVCFKKLMGQHVGGRHCTYDAYVVGGMMEKTLVGYRAASCLLGHMSRSPGKFNLRLCCVYSLNTCGRTGQPLARSLAFDPLTRLPYPLSAVGAGKEPAAEEVPGRRGEKRGPGLEQRLAHFWLTDEGFADLRQVYCPWEQNYTLPGRMYTVPKWLLVQGSYLLTLCDAGLLEQTSTTPHFEGENFCSDIRQALGYIVKQPEGMFMYRGGAWSWDGGVWCEVRSAKAKRLRGAQPAGYHDEPRVDIPGSSWSCSSLVDLEKEHLELEQQS
ncbi:protein N-terminal asparagine amidohydrolase [Chloropicon primus]|uniref:Protein N-terminal asparagine amidohydrolase n=1 Tax=Chloropicon primus TaxID=1764295 RepID=A0A5B8MJN1_9CHLO|nr:hypothetical protein A3770_04p31910 [Chloropicon primus]UPQ99885.1 protein N-terminal asparagine amidohydrolase [Chloropicon primus]|mmetsp:Transcript_22367/g.47008  ORF Transcript_22367/g.47008 Transcript_22367/m.47008 type:complete len:373 (-) Transcript_22367:83-1201(-)|eukprot:QDZ20673.1 hypothetical protein A3770_04p31910 [Chloropicon primus]